MVSERRYLWAHVCVRFLNLGRVRRMCGSGRLEPRNVSELIPASGIIITQKPLSNRRTTWIRNSKNG
jgi:hypothetical protein